MTIVSNNSYLREGVKPDFSRVWEFPHFSCLVFRSPPTLDGTPGSLFVLQADVEEKVIVESSLNINEKRKKIVNALNAVMGKIQPLSQHSVLL